ncbi:MAG: hypothetical protein ABIS50_07860 [Luteolibacter sp.]|uniref:hypothetical protein n=1 Tax=Luteolibacter sp. TaxID=1962973 RepID=UPI003267E0AB
MMKFRLLSFALIALAASSCDKAKSLVGKARSAVASEIAKQGESGSTKPDPALQKLVDQTAEGVVFRKDLPFPTHIETKVTRVSEVSIRSSEASAIEKTSKQVKGTQTEIGKFERSDDQIRYTNLESTFIDSGTEEDKQAAIHQAAKASKPLVFIKSGSSWKSNGTDFLSAALSKTLSPVFDQILVENALAPRTLWFGKRRFKIGDQLAVTGATLPMLVAGKATGSFNLTLESFEAVDGHPCGVFKVTGDYSRKQFPDIDGNLTDEDVTIQSGKFWLSLIYPIILREETDTIQTISSGERGNLATHGRGTRKISLVREWKITTK